MALWKDFKQFAFKGNVVDLAVGVVIGAAFGKIIQGVVNNVIMPVVGLVLPSGNWREAAFTLQERAPDGPENDVRLLVGELIGVTIDFLIVAFVLFLVVRAITRLKHQAPPPAANDRECPYCLEHVPKPATRCKACTSELQPVPQEPAKAATA